MRSALIALLLVAPALAQDSPLPPGAVARVGSPRMRHQAEVCALAYSPDGKWLASVDTSNQVQISDAFTGKTRNRFAVQSARQAPEMEVVPLTKPMAPAVVRFTVDGRITVAAAGVLGTYGLDGQGAWANPSFRPRDRCLAISADGTAAVTGDSTLRCIDGLTRKNRLDNSRGERPSRTFRSHDPVNGDQITWQTDTPSPARAEFTRHGLLTKGQFTVRLYDTKKGKLCGEWAWMKPGDLMAIALSPVGDRLVAVTTTEPDRPAAGKCQIVLLDTRTGRERVLPIEISGGEQAVFSPDVRTAAVAARDGIHVVDLKSGQIVRTIVNGNHVTRLTFSPDGRTLAGACGSVVCQWDVATGRPLPASADPAGDVHRLRFVDSRRLLVFAGDIAEYDWPTGKATKRFPVPPHARATGDEISPDGSLAAVVEPGSIRLIETATGKIRHQFAIATGVSVGGHCAFSPDSKRLYFLASERCQTWDCATGRPTPLINAAAGNGDLDAESEGLAPELSPDGRWIVGPAGRRAGEDDVAFVIRQWNARDGAKVRDLPINGIASAGAVFSVDGRRFAIVTQFSEPAGIEDAVTAAAELVVWDSITGKLICRRRLGEGGFASLDLSPDGRSFVCGHSDGSVTVHEVATGVERAKFTGHQQPVVDVAFSPCGRYVASISSDAPVFVWDLYAALPLVADRSQLWADLSRDDRSFSAMRRLAFQPETAVTLFRERIQLIAPVNPERLQQWLADLDHRRFAVRSRAAGELERVADQAEAELLKRAADPQSSAEVRRAIRQILEHSDEPGRQFVAGQRALEVLERIDTPAARGLVAEWAAGAPAARFTLEAHATLARMKR